VIAWLAVAAAAPEGAFPVPTMAQLAEAQPWVIGTKGDQVARLVDHGWVGAVEGPEIAICVEKTCVDGVGWVDGPPDDPIAWRQAHLDRLWAEKATEIQALLAGFTPKTRPVFPTPTLAELPEAGPGWLVGRAGDRFATLADHGWQGAVDGPQLSLCVGKTCVESHEYVPTPSSEAGAWRQRQLEHLWRAESERVQALLQGFTPLTRADAVALTWEMAGLTLAVEPKTFEGAASETVTRVTAGPKVVWEAGVDPFFDRATVLRGAKVGDTVWLTIKTEVDGGCCVELTSLRLPAPP